MAKTKKKEKKKDTINRSSHSMNPGIYLIHYHKSISIFMILYREKKFDHMMYHLEDNIPW